MDLNLVGMEIKEAKAIASVFIAVHTSASVRLARGASERKRVLKALKAGEDVQSYRLDWLRSATAEVVDQLAHIAQRFNDSYQFDQCSVADLMDLLDMATEKLKKD